MKLHEIEKRLEHIRGELRAERISYDELHELQSLAKYIDPSDVQLREAAGLPEDAPNVFDAAPDLLEALENLVMDWERCHREIPKDHEAKAAIAKAKGQAA